MSNNPSTSQGKLSKLNLNSKNIKDLENIFQDILTTCPQVFDWDLSNNWWTTLPSNWNGWKSLQILDIRNNKFKSLSTVVPAWKSIPNWTDLRIDINTKEDSLLILENLPNLQFLNGTSTKEEDDEIQEEPPAFFVDWEDPETISISLDNEKPLFTEIYSFISDKLKLINKGQSEMFWKDFGDILKNEILKINQSVEMNSPNYIYATNVLDSVVKILNFFNIKFNDYLKTKDEESAEIIKKINDHYFNTSIKLVNLLFKLSPKIEENANVLKSKYEKEKKWNENENENVPRGNADDKLQNVKQERDAIVKHYQDEIRIYQSKIDQLEKENALMTTKLLNNAKNIIKQTAPIPGKCQNKPVHIQDNVNHADNSNNHNHNHNHNHHNLGSTAHHALRKNRSNLLLSNNNKSNNSMNSINEINIGNRIFTLKMMKDTIKEIYSSKVDFNKKCEDSQLPRETMEQHMYTFLNQKYGLKSIIIEWATNIISGIRVFSSEDSEVFLFGKILRNELEEDARWFWPMLKNNIGNILRSILRRKNPNKNNKDISNLLNAKLNLSNNTNVPAIEWWSDEYKEILLNLYDEEDAKILEDKISEICSKKREMLMNSPICKIEQGKKWTRDEMIMIGQQKEDECYSVSYKDFLKILHEFQIRSREKYWKKFVILFKKSDTDNNGILNEEEFIQFVQSFNIYSNDNFDEHVERLLSIIDPYCNKQITFSECVSLFSMEMIDEGEWENSSTNNQEEGRNREKREICILDKICLSEPK